MNKDQKIKELMVQNDDLENYFRNTIIPQLFFDHELILCKFTPAAMKQFKLTADDIGRSIHEVVNNLRFPSIVENITWVIENAEVLEKEIQTTDLRWFQMNVLPYLQRESNIANGVIITFIDITHRIKDLKEQEKLITDYESLIDSISHDIKNPLTSLLLSIDMLNNVGAEDKAQFKTLLKIVKNGVLKVSDIINDLTEARKEEHKYKAIEELLVFENILEDVQLALLDDIKNTDARIKKQLEVSEIVFPRRQLRSIVYNLVNNAIKFKSPERKPEIFISTTRQDNFIFISVKDNGIGIEPAKQEEVFSKYFRIEQTVEGSGIGLYLVKSLVTNAGGKIMLESQLNVGTEVKIYLQDKV